MKTSTPDIARIRYCSKYIVMIGLFYILSLSHACAGTSGGESFSHFSLSIEERRSERRIAGPNLDAVPVYFDSKSRLMGRLTYYKNDSSIVFTSFNDSIIYNVTSPTPVKTFMSADTMYYSTEAPRNVISKGYIPKYDSLLACIFRGEALRIRIELASPCGPGNPMKPSGFSEVKIADVKKECSSGEYSHINLPISLGAFFVSFPSSNIAKNSVWTGFKPLPSFSGIHFHPIMRLAFKTVDVKPGKVTAVFTADTVFKDVTITTPSKKRIVILNDKIHIGGTVIMDLSLGMPQMGEVRIEENIQLLRPELSSHVGRRECSYVIRFKVH